MQSRIKGVMYAMFPGGIGTPELLVGLVCCLGVPVLIGGAVWLGMLLQRNRDRKSSG